MGRLAKSDAERMNRLLQFPGHEGRHEARIHADGVHGAADVVIEVASPSTSVRDLMLKREIYRRGGVPEYWVVDPEAETVTLFRLQERGEPRVFRAAERLSSPALPRFAPEIASLFAR